MATGVHDENFIARLVNSSDKAGVGQPGLLLERQSVQVGPDQHGWPGAVFQNPDQAKPADVFGHLKAEAAKLTSDARHGLLFLIGQFRVLMEIEI